jgi:hypothetical protein
MLSLWQAKKNMKQKQQINKNEIKDLRYEEGTIIINTIDVVFSINKCTSK